MLFLILFSSIFPLNHIYCDEIEFPTDLKFTENLNLNNHFLGNDKLLGLQRSSSGHVDEFEAGSYEWETIWNKYIVGYKFVLKILFK